VTSTNGSALKRRASDVVEIVHSDGDGDDGSIISEMSKSEF
jgi:hypothetical protein